MLTPSVFSGSPKLNLCRNLENAEQMRSPTANLKLLQVLS